MMATASIRSRWFVSGITELPTAFWQILSDLSRKDTGRCAPSLYKADFLDQLLRRSQNRSIDLVGNIPNHGTPRYMLRG